MLIDRKINVTIEPRPDGGLRVSSEDMPGLILSGEDQKVVLRMMGDAIVALAEYKRDHPVAFAN